jgi:hypothetical protein
MRIDIVTFDYNGKRITGMYINGSLKKHGDYNIYEEKIDHYIEGFIEGINEVSDIPADVTRYVCSSAAINSITCEMGGPPPKTIHEMKQSIYQR